MRSILASVAITATFGLLHNAATAGEPEQFFASIFYDEKKIGHFHVRMHRGDAGEIEEIRTRASVSILGISLFEYSHDLTHTWQGEELEAMAGRIDHDGTITALELKRTPQGLFGTVNGDPVELPADAFPNSIWHYSVIDARPLFDETTLNILDVGIAVSEDTVSFAGDTIAATRAVFSGDLDATVWFDGEREFIKSRLTLDGKTIDVHRDPPG